MPAQINANYSANFQKFVDFANKAYATKGEDTVARFEGMPRGDYKGTFASFRRTSDMKAANDLVRDLFRKTVADMFGGERNIPDIVRDNMKLDDFGKGKPLTARRINLVRIAIDTLGGGKFTDPASISKATSMGYVASEIPKLARVANIYQQATGCTDEEAETAALDPNSKARRLYDYGGRFTQNVDGFKAGLGLMDKFSSWYDDLAGDREAKLRDTPTKRNVNFVACSDKAKIGVEKFVFEELSVNGNIPLDAQTPEDIFGMEKNPAMQFVGRGYATSLSNSLAQMQPEKRKLIYAVFSALDPLPDASSDGKRVKVDYCLLVAARVMKNYDAIAALQKSNKLNRANLVPILYPDVEASPESSNSELSTAVLRRLSQNPMTMGQIMFLAENSGATFDEAEAALASGTRLENAPGISSFTGKLEEMDGTARGGRNTMILDLNRASPPVYTENEEPVITEENIKFVFHLPNGETLEAINGSESDPEVVKASKTIADKVAELCGNVHPKQLSNVYYALSQSALSVNLNGGFLAHGISSNEHMAVTFTLSRNDKTGDVTIKYSEPKGFPVKFNWTTTIDVEGKSTTTPMRIDHGQYETEAMKHVDAIAAKLPGNDKAAAEKLVKDMLAHCGDDFDLKDVVSRRIANICITATAQLRSSEKIKERIDTIADNFREFRELSKDKPAIYEAGKRMMVAMDGKALPPGMIAKLVLEASKAKIDAIRKLSPHSSALEIHRAITQFSDNIVKVMVASGAEEKTDGANEKQACRNFIAAVMIDRCGGDKALRAMQGAFAGDKPAKMLALYESVVNSQQNEGVEERLIVPFENLAAKHMMNIANLKGAIDVALDGDFGEDIVSFNGEFSADEINATEILDDLLNLAARQ